MLADLYDFDKTVFRGESGMAFWSFCLKRHPKIIKHLPSQLKGLFGHYVFHKIDKKQSKELFYSYLVSIDAEKEAKLFWQKNAKKMNNWFNPDNHDVATVVCSASPVFQIKPICDKLGVDVLIATRMNPATGKITGKNCKGTEKVERIKKEAPNYTFRDSYTDNIISDKPLLDMATRNKIRVTNGSRTKI